MTLGAHVSVNLDEVLDSTLVKSSSGVVAPRRRVGFAGHLFGHRAAVIGLSLFMVATLIAVAAPLMAPADPNQMDLPARLMPPSRESLLGTDVFGRDVLSRVIWGARVSIVAAIVIVLLASSFGIVLGLLASYFEGPVCAVAGWLIDVLLALPSLLLALAIVAAVGPGLGQTIAAVSVAFIPRFARLQRSLVLTIKETDYVVAARATGAKDSRIIVRHILPNTVGPLVVMATVSAAHAILMEASFSFLGLGVQPPTASWGLLISEGRRYLRSGPWVSLSAGLAILFTSLGLNLLGDGLRDALDPRMRGLPR